MDEEANVCFLYVIRRVVFHDYLNMKLNPFVELHETGNDFDWDGLYALYQEIKHNIAGIYELRFLCEYMFRLFGYFECSSGRLMFAMMDLYGNTMDTYQSLQVCPRCEGHILFEHYRDEHLVDVEPMLLDYDEDPTYDYNNRRFYSQLTKSAVNKGHYYMVHTLVKFGLSYENTDRRLYINTLIARIARFRLGDREGFNHNEEEAIFRIELLLAHLVTTEDLNPKRMTMVMRILLIVINDLRGDNHIEKRVACCELIMKTWAEPAITVSDFSTITRIVFPEPMYARNLQTMRSQFVRLFPDSESSPTPRSLLHLSRCKIRDCLTRTPSLPAVISQLNIRGRPLPIQIIQYLTDFE